MNKNKNILISGFALFSMFFGAGNLLFAPALGERMGTDYLVSSVGFITAGVGLVMLAVIASMKAGGSILEATSIVSKKFGRIFSTVAILAIGPGLAIPRTAATTYEVIKESMMPNLNPIIASVIFFLCVLFFVMRPSNVVENLGKFLTPVLLLVLGIIIFKGFTSPISTPVDKNLTGVFGLSFEEGYQTMDAIAALIFARIIYNDFINKGYKDKNEILSMTIKAAIIAGVGLAIIYFGLIYIGASASGKNLAEMGRTKMLIYVTYELLGKFGNITLSICMALACLTTAIGLTVTVGDYFKEMFKGKVSYNFIIIISSIFSGFTAVNGVDKIVSISAPILIAIYPTAITLIFLNAFVERLGKRGIVIGATIGSLIPALSSFISLFRPETNLLRPLDMILPASLHVFSWVIPVVILGAVFHIFKIGERGN